MGNVLALVVVTGTGQLVTCSATRGRAISHDARWAFGNAPSSCACGSDSRRPPRFIVTPRVHHICICARLTTTATMPPKISGWRRGLCRCSTDHAPTRWIPLPRTRRRRCTAAAVASLSTRMKARSWRSSAHHFGNALPRTETVSASALDVLSLQVATKRVIFPEVQN
jgi:hypothetical protein